MGRYMLQQVLYSLKYPTYSKEEKLEVVNDAFECLQNLYANTPDDEHLRTIIEMLMDGLSEVHLRIYRKEPYDV